MPNEISEASKAAMAKAVLAPSVSTTVRTGTAAAAVFKPGLGGVALAPGGVGAPG